MQLRKLVEGPRSTVAVVMDEPNDQSSLLLQLEALAKQHTCAKGFRVLFQRYATSGRDGLTVEQFHEANRQEQIWEFVKGRLRVCCFMDKDCPLLLLSHVFVKKNQKSPTSELQVAISLRDRFLRAKAQGQLTLESKT